MSDERAADARADFADLTIVRYPHAPLSDRVWELRDNLTAYDAAYLELAQRTGFDLASKDADLCAAA